MYTVVAGVRRAMALYSKRNSDDMNLRKADFDTVCRAWVRAALNTSVPVTVAQQSGLCNGCGNPFRQTAAAACSSFSFSM